MPSMEDAAARKPKSGPLRATVQSMDCFDSAMLLDLNIPPEAWKPKEGIPFCEAWDYAEVDGEGDVEVIRVLWNRMTGDRIVMEIMKIPTKSANEKASILQSCRSKILDCVSKLFRLFSAQFIYDLYCAVCVPAMEYDPVLPQFAVPSVLLTSIIECISENFISFDLQEIFTANDLLSHKVQAWFAVLKLFDSIYECLFKEKDEDKDDGFKGEAVAKVEIPSAKDDKDLQVPKKIAPSRTAPKPRSVIYSPRLQYLRQKRMRNYRRKNVAPLKSDKHRLLSDLKAIPELSICMDSAVKRRHYLNSLKRARISCQNIQWRQRHLKAQVVRMKANLENKLHKKQLLINDFKDKISRKLLNEMNLIEEKDFTI
ncbi:hypothetical protein T02_2392 [Trichinella nativa]|uniref:Uncharacterized protein n=1 Tax=Trichinella nativa TaxID=6335 RepID=A0A0V1KNK9_9BILA|nr:hypothetical protein T06_15892 [Trichinella sp. T6]KRZ48694.1 hypothetical protein T02_2392 [Trichinella nativa]